MRISLADQIYEAPTGFTSLSSSTYYSEVKRMRVKIYFGILLSFVAWLFAIFTFSMQDNFLGIFFSGAAIVLSSAVIVIGAVALYNNRKDSRKYCIDFEERFNCSETTGVRRDYDMGRFYLEASLEESDFYRNRGIEIDYTEEQEVEENPTQPIIPTTRKIRS